MLLGWLIFWRSSKGWGNCYAGAGGDPMSASHILAIAMAAIAFLCFAIAGFEENNFATWVDGAGISLILYGLVRGSAWLISAPDLAGDAPRVPNPYSQETAPPEPAAQEAAPQEAALQEATHQEAASLRTAPEEAVTQVAAPQEAAPQEPAPALSLEERIKQLRETAGR